MERRLAAILAADVVGYSRLMGEDEAGTLAALKAHREELIEPKIAEHKGRIVKLMGDGVLAEFPSAVEAVQFAVQMQHTMAERNADVPEERRIIYRMGINIGDIVVEGDDIYGDGVNIAARLEPLADPGGLCVSRTVITHIKGKIDIPFEDLGDQNMKNIAEPVNVWCWSDADAPAAREYPEGRSLTAATEVPIIAVLPFDSLSADEEVESFADGLTEELIMAFSRQTGMAVLARNSTFAFKGKAIDVTRIGRRLGAHYVLEGSVRKSGVRVRVTAQLVATDSGNPLWGEQYDGELSDAFKLQDEVTFEIVAAARSQIHVKDARRARTLPEDQLSDSELLSIASQRMQALDVADYRKAARLTERVVHRSPENAMALAMSASCILLVNELDYRDIPEPDATEAFDRIERSIRLNEESDYAHYVCGRLLLHLRHRHDLAIAEAERALELNPNYTYAIALLGFAIICRGDPERGIPMIERALRADLRRAGSFNFIEYLALGHFLAARYDLAIEWREKAAQRAGYLPETRFFLASCFALLDRLEEARAQLQTALEAAPDARLAELRKLPFKDPAADRRFRDGLRKAGMPD